MKPGVFGNTAAYGVAVESRAILHLIVGEIDLTSYCL